MEKIIQLLHEGNYSCVIANGDDIRTFTQRGVADLYDLIKNDAEFLKDSSVADKVIGKAAAVLMIHGGVREIYTDMISLPAVELLAKTTIKLKYKQQVPNIMNRDQSGWCPLEKMTYEEESIEQMFELIEDFILKMRSANNK